MRRRELLALPFAAATAAPQTKPAGTPVQRPPNILLLLYDKCRTDAIGAYEGIRDRTPNLNQLAAAGVRFEHAYTPQALCAPARASMLTAFIRTHMASAITPIPELRLPHTAVFLIP